MLDGREQRESANTSDPKQAEKFLKARRDELGAHRLGVQVFTTVAMKKITVRDLLESLKADFTQRDKASASNLSGLRIADSRFGHLKATELRPAHIDAYIAEQKAAGYANASINRITGLVAQAFDLSIQQERLSRKPFIKHLSEKGNERQGFCDAATFARVRENLPADLRDFAQFAFSTGWRRGEIASLDWSNIQDNDGMIRLRPAQAKNKTGRSVPVTGELIGIIKRRREARTMQVNGTTELSRLVFHRNGRTVHEFRKSWATACKKADVPNLLFHDLRRSSVTAMTQAGVPQLIAMQISGHKTASMFKRYNISVEAELANAMQATEAYHAAQTAKTHAAQNVRAISK
jgi:integrase